VAAAGTAPDRSSFRHEALFYAGDADFVARTVPFILDGVAHGEPVLVVVPGSKLALLRDALGREADGVTFGDMDAVGRNPSRIIPVWRRFEADRPPGRPARGIGEPVHPARSADELVECRRHETLLNVAFAGTYDWSLVCPYDVAALPPDVVAEAMTTHPYVRDEGTSAVYQIDLPDDPLPPRPANAVELTFGGRDPLDVVHTFVRGNAAAAGLSLARIDDLAMAVHELAINSLTHAGGRGVVAFWHDEGDVFCEVRDAGIIRDPLVGRTDPELEQEGGRGVWIVNRLCDLVQVRSSAAGTSIRVRMSLAR